MSSPLFQFELRPLDQIEPWGKPENPHLHWFGLTDGHYWIQAGEHKLFEYTSTVQATLGVPRFCDYQIVRLYEDVIELAPYALEPVPQVLQRYIALDESKPWNFYWTNWYQALEVEGTFDEVMKCIDDARPWIGRRKLDSGYLSPSTNIVIWSDENTVHLQWDNREKLLQNHQAWSAQFGSWQLSREDFMSEVRSFHDRLMKQMAERVSQIAAGGLKKNVHVDVAGLRREQLARSQPLASILVEPAHATDWSLVITAVQTLETCHR